MESVDKSRVDVHPMRVSKKKKAASRYKRSRGGLLRECTRR